MKTSKIISLLSENRLEEAFENFEHFFEKVQALHSGFINSQRQFNKVTDKQRKQIIAPEIADREMNIITDKLFNILSEIETSINAGSEVEVPSKESKNGLSKAEKLEKKANDAITDKGFQVIEEIYSELSYIFYKAKRNDSSNSNFYVVQLLNQYQLIDADFPYDEKLKSFFTSKDCDPFVQIQSFTESGNPCYTIRDYVDGIDLNNLIEKKIKLSLLDTITSIITIAYGLKNLHTKDIIYSNFIPSQIIMNQKGGAEILPMNIFKTNSAVVTWKQLKNSIRYMSPEQLVKSLGGNTDKALTPNCNQYSLGQIIFLMINGESIFDGEDLVELYKDRNDTKDTISQLRGFVDTINEKLNYYSFPEEEKDEIGSEFIETFNQLIKFNPEERFKNIYKFILKMESLKGQLEMVKMDFGDDDLCNVQESFENSVLNNKNIIDVFYENLSEEISPRASLEAKGRNILIFYSMKYLFNTITNLDHTDGLTHGLSCLVQSLHNDFEMNDFEIFFEVLKNTIQENNPEDWNDGIGEAWDTFNQKVLDAIDGILMPQLPGS